MSQIAIVEDNTDCADLVDLTLRNNHESRKFSNGSEFLKVFRRGSFDLILLDLAMPEMNGFEVFQRLRALDENVPVVAVSALPESVERDKAMALGFCDYFAKPIDDIDHFRQAVYSRLGGGSRLK